MVYMSNQTVDELYRIAEDEQNSLALRIYEQMRQQATDAETVGCGLDCEIREYAINDLPEVATAVAKLIIHIRQHRGTAEAAKEAAGQFVLSMETDFGPGVQELYDEFTNIITKACN